MSNKEKEVTDKMKTFSQMRLLPMWRIIPKIGKSFIHPTECHSCG